MPVAIDEEFKDLKRIEGSPFSTLKKSKRKSKKTGDISDSSNPHSPPVEEKEVEEMIDPEWTIVNSSGGRFNETPILYSQDAEMAYAAMGPIIKVYNLSTGLCVGKMMPNSSDQEVKSNQVISGLAVHPANPFQIVSTTFGGTVNVWDPMECKLLKTWELGLHIVDLTTNPNKPRNLYLTTHYPSKDDPKVTHSSVFKFNLEKGHKKCMRNVRRKIEAMTLSPDGRYFVVGGGNIFEVWSLEKGGGNRHSYYSVGITSIAVHPTEPYVAIGDKEGKITFWYVLDLPDYRQKPVTSTVHWHAHQIRSLRFTNDGVYLLSGGEEGVLVIWQMTTRTKHFLPHLGSDILSISIHPKQLSYLLHLKENSIKLVSALNTEIKQSFSGIMCANADRSLYPVSTGLVIEPRSKALVLNGYPGTLQFFSHATDSDIRQVEITARNRISKMEDKELLYPHASHVAFSQTGAWMATIDERPDPTFETERFLHFWKWDAEEQTYLAHTRIDHPHQGKVTGLAFRHSNEGNLIAVTSGFDNCFKLWELRTYESSGEQAWNCRWSGSYKGMPAHAAEFSADGSLLFVSFGRVITIWDPEENTLEKVLSYSLSDSPVNQLAFSRDSIFLVTSSATHVYVWNLLTCTVWWCMPMKVQRIKSDPYSNRLMVVASPSDDRISQALYLFDAASPIPIYSRFIAPDQPQVLASTFIMHKGQSGMLFLDDLHKLTVWSQRTELSDDSEQLMTKIYLKSEKSKLFSNLFGSPGVRPAAVTPGVSPISVRSPDSNLPAEFLSIPTAMAPTPTSFVGEFLSSFLTSSSSLSQTTVT